MENSPNSYGKQGVKSFPRSFWTVITMEFFERGSYYGVMSVLSVYLVMSIPEGGLGFSKESVGAIKSTITPLLYFLPILAGALADRFGYRRTLMMAFTEYRLLFHQPFNFLWNGIPESYPYGRGGWIFQTGNFGHDCPGN
jgi:MFS family permease